MNRFQDIAAIEWPSKGNEVAQQMFGADSAVCRHEAILDVGKHRVCPTEGGVARRHAIGTGDVALVNDAWLLGNAVKPMATVADDCGAGLNTGAKPLGFTGLKSAHDLEFSVDWPSI